MEGDQEDIIHTEEFFQVTHNEVDSQPNQYNNKLFWEKILFFVSMFAVVSSATVLVVTIPLYLEAVNVKGDAYSTIIFTCSVSAVLLGAVCIGGQLLWPLPRRSFGPPLPLMRLIRAGILNAVSGVIFVYSLDRKRVLCHLQDPIMGVILVFSLVFYFFFCGKMMGLQKIFCATTIIVGLFISVDYQLCDEFRCHGSSREPQSDESVRLSWRSHAVWTLVYIGGLAVWTLNFTLLEGEVYRSSCIHSSYAPASLSSTSLLSTISRLVATKDRLRRMNNDACRSPLLASSSDVSNTVLDGMSGMSSTAAESQPISGIQIQDSGDTSQCHGCRLPSPPALAFWIHIVTMLAILCLCWTDMLPYIGKGASAAESWELITSGLSCHFGGGGESCKMVAQRGWAFAIAYTVFFLTSTVLLVLSESSVLTMATPTAALPLASIFWSVLHDGGLSGQEPGLHLAPAVTGELICALLGLPVVLVGLGLFCKSHWAERAQAESCRQLLSGGTRRVVIVEEKHGDTLDSGPN
ncbi:uncharacterized protein LOC124163213 [Ischnura elegans]|uniref:uncharacterized protein LOC124163213 n=1 Tax=Ischnura elegans TaxID=197161 RepID=UPI001ED8771A|nr:uncharacterized protein LOC124163213 [Ischnura elegans]